MEDLECKASFGCKGKNLFNTVFTGFFFVFVVLYSLVQTCQRILLVGNEGLVNILSNKVYFKV